MPRIKFLEMNEGGLAFLLVDIVYTEQSTCKGRRLTEGNEQSLVDLSLRVNKDAAKEKDKSTDGENKRRYELKIGLHVS